MAEDWAGGSGSMAGFLGAWEYLVIWLLSWLVDWLFEWQVS